MKKGGNWMNTAEQAFVLIALEEQNPGAGGRLTPIVRYT